MNKKLTYPWMVTLKIKNPLMVKYKSLNTLNTPLSCENETVLMHLPYDNVEEAYEYCKNLGIDTWCLGRADIKNN